MNPQAQEIWVSSSRPRCQGIGQSLQRRWRWVVMFVLAALALGTTIASRSEQQYAARTRIRLIGDRAIGFSSEYRAADDASSARAQHYVLRSPRILSPVAERLSLAERWGTDLTGATQRLGQMVAPRKLVDANVTELKVIANDGELAAQIANSIVEVYINQANQPRMEQSQMALTRLRRECDEQAERLRQTEQELHDIQKQSGLDLGQGQMSAATLAPLRQILVQAEAGLIDAQLRVESLAVSSGSVVTALESVEATDTVARRLATRLIEGEAKLAELSSRYGQDHPNVRSAQKQYDQLLSAGHEQMQRMIDQAKVDQDAAETRAAYARQKLTSAESTLVTAGGSYGQLLAVSQREDVQRNLHKMLLDRAQKLEVDMKLAGPAAEVLEPAVTATMPELGTPMQIMMIALGIGLAAGMLSAIAVDRTDASIRGPEEVEWLLDLPMLGTISRAMTMEDFRMVRNSIDFADHTLRTLCITSAGGNEGTSATTVNLARAWAEHGGRVLLIDTNLRFPMLHRHMAVSNERGLVDFLANKQPLQPLIVQTSIANVSILPAGRTEKGKTPPALTPQQLNELLMWARSQADLVIFDSAPVLASSDTGIVARQSDGTVLIAKQGGSKISNLRRAIHILGKTGEGLLGVVLSGVAFGANWDPMPMRMANEEETMQHRTRIARTRKPIRHAA